MRKILSTVLLTLTVLCGKSQVILNEIYSDPSISKKHNEFFELYNTNVNASGVQLDCYTLVVYWKTSNTDSGLYVLDLPNIGIKNQRYYVGSSAINLTAQGSSATADFSWNNLGGTGYLKKYQVVKNGSTYSYQDVTTRDITSQYNDVFQTIQGGGDLAVFLFKEGVYVNGLIVGFNTTPPTSLPSQISNMPNLTVNYSSTLGSTCTGSFVINWKTITSAEFSTGGGSGGNDNGFARAYDGSCGSWVKTSNSPNHTPGRPNVPGNSIVTPLIQTVERRICGTQIDFQITGATYQTAFPVTVQLYLDDNADGQLDASDPIDPVYQVQIYSASDNIYTVSNLDPTERYILVYRTALGCYDKVATPTPLTIDLITTQKNICNQRLDFTVGTPTTNAATYSYYSLPMEVLLFNDVNKDGILNEDTTNKQNLIGERTVTSLPTSGSLDIPHDTKVIIVYKTAYGCFSKIGQLAEVTGTLLTTQTNMCGKRIDFSITGASNTDVASYILNKDISVQLLVDGAPIGSPQTINFSAYPYSGSVVVPGGSSPIGSASKVELVYTPFFTCFAAKAPATYTTPTITLSGDISCPTNVAGKSTLSFTIQNISDPIAYPIKLWYVEDNATAGEGDDITVEHPDQITSIPNSPYTADLQNLKSNVTLYAQSVQAGCATGNSIVPNNCTVLPVHFQSFNATRNKEKKEQVILKWITATEQNNRGFNVQRKVGGQWKNIAYIFSQAENGNSSTALAYEYKDMNVLNTVTQYQIQQVDYDGKTSYSDIKAVPGMEQKKAVLIYPNPGVDGKINLLFSELGGVKEVIVSDMNGRIVKQYRQVTENNLSIEGLLTGFYTIKITDRTTAVTTVEKVIIR